LGCAKRKEGGQIREKEGNRVVRKMRLDSETSRKNMSDSKIWISTTSSKVSERKRRPDSEKSRKSSIQSKSTASLTRSGLGKTRVPKERRLALNTKQVAAEWKAETPKAKVEQDAFSEFEHEMAFR